MPSSWFLRYLSIAVSLWYIQWVTKVFVARYPTNMWTCVTNLYLYLAGIFISVYMYILYKHAFLLKRGSLIVLMKHWNFARGLKRRTIKSKRLLDHMQCKFQGSTRKDGWWKSGESGSGVGLGYRSLCRGWLFQSDWLCVPLDILKHIN